MFLLIFKKLRNVVDNDVVKNTVCDELVKKLILLTLVALVNLSTKHALLIT